MTCTAPIAVGDVIHGFAYGAFGRDHYHCVRVEAIGPDWIVARDPGNERESPSFAAGARSLKLCTQARDEGHRAAMERAGGKGDEPCSPTEARPPLTTWSSQP
ncbi:hypothetical protein ACIOEX_01670 [Streptomyces sp. NPDC087850]|uniref:hypothetical protein n=1 Tax=Streptomyces sp. NPDC087850 TaxID=3365809 RepID=UPI0037FA652F